LSWTNALVIYSTEELKSWKYTLYSRRWDKSLMSEEEDIAIFGFESLVNVIDTANGQHTP
jgi:hypothetical protein